MADGQQSSVARAVRCFPRGGNDLDVQKACDLFSRAATEVQSHTPVVIFHGARSGQLHESYAQPSPVNKAIGALEGPSIAFGCWSAPCVSHEGSPALIVCYAGRVYIMEWEGHREVDELNVAYASDVLDAVSMLTGCDAEQARELVLQAYDQAAKRTTGEIRDPWSKRFLLTYVQVHKDAVVASVRQHSDLRGS